VSNAVVVHAHRPVQRERLQTTANRVRSSF
jgi:hypothetical protein